MVLAAGAVASPLLLLRSGIGPADELRAAGVPVRLDLPGVGRDWSDHPAVFVPFADTDPPAHPHAPGSQAALNLDCGADPAGDAEVLLFVRPFTPGGDLHLMCALQAPDSRGTISITSAGPAGRPRDPLPLPAHRARPAPAAARRSAPPPSCCAPGSARAPPRPATCWATTAPWTAGSPST